MPQKFKLLNDKFLILLIFFVSLSINQYFGNIGVYATDSFAFFDTGFRVLNKEFPFKDYWVVSGPLIDYFQAFLFFIFGVNWQSYILQASIVNGLLSIFTFIFLRKLNLDCKSSFFYSLCLAILAYPVSGTPFVEQHSVFLSFIAIYSFILGIKTQKNYFYLMCPFFFGLAFISKQVPAAYLFLSLLPIIVYEIFLNDRKKNFKMIFLLFISSLIFLCTLMLLFWITETKVESFVNQYLLYPLTIGEDRIANTNLTFSNVFIKYKLVYLSILPFAVITLKNILKNKKYLKTINFKIFLLLIFVAISLTTHQALTKNQAFVFFMIPLFIALGHLEISSHNLKGKKIFLSFLIVTCIYLTFKFHTQINTVRKFHDFKPTTNFNNSIDGERINQIFSGLNWISPDYSSPELIIKEMDIIKNIIIDLKKDKRKKMLITQYAFFSIILNENLHAPSRWHVLDGSAYPVAGSEFYDYYKKYFINILKNNNIEVIYITKNVGKKEKPLFGYLDRKCVKERKKTDHITSYTLDKNCEEFNRIF